MKRNRWMAAILAMLCMLAAGCGTELKGPESAPSHDGSAGSRNTEEAISSAPQKADAEMGEAQSGAGSPESSSAGTAAEIDRDAALRLAFENAGVRKEDAYNVQVERDRENDISIFQVEFETEYGDYDFEIAAADGRIVGADYEVDEEWLDKLGGSPVSLEEARRIIQSKVPGSDAADIRIWEESGDGRGRFEGELLHEGIQYEFEIDPKTGVVFDWNAYMRE